jgi:replicative DNA helicase
MVQLQVLNRILETGDSSIITLNNFDDSYFSDYKEEFNFIKNHYTDYGVVPDKETFIDKFNDFDFIAVNEPTKYLLDKLVEDKNKRNLIKTFNKVRDYINADDLDNALKTFRESADKLSETISLESTDIFKDISRYDKYVERCSDFNKYYVSTGFKELDEVLGGWDRQEELAVIMARTNQGKSWLLLKCAIAAAEQGLNVGLYSGEMSETKVGYRVDTLISHISNTCIIQGNSAIQNDYKRYMESLQNGKIKGSIKVLTPSQINGPAGVTALRAFVEKEKLDMLCVDQHSLLEDDRRAKSPVERASNISKDLKNLQVLKKIPIVSVSQQNRGDTSEGITTMNIAQSDRIGQDSTVVLAFEQKDGVLNLQIIKARDAGAGKKLQYAINFDKGTFEFMPADNDALNGKGSEDLKEMYEDDGDEVF